MIGVYETDGASGTISASLLTTSLVVFGFYFFLPGNPFSQEIPHSLRYGQGLSRISTFFTRRIVLNLIDHHRLYPT